MGRIIVLDENTSNKIAAGEVVEKPASVVKELVENSIDAGATSISVDIRNGGISYIKVTDNGGGMDEDDVEIAFERHATSKIKRAEDLDSIITMGFRGEALASIAAVSSVELQTRAAGKTYGMYVHISGGSFKEVRQTGCPVGTTFIIKDLFYNTPARYKFLKKDSTEAGYISDTISRIALGNPDISFKLTSGKTQLIHTPGNNDLKSAIYSVYGKEIIRELMEVNYQDDKYKIIGYVGKPEAARANRNYQSLYINKRYVKSKFVSYAVEQAYNSILMKNKFPFFVLSIELNPLLVDANVSPAKTEVRFAEESYLSRAIYMAVSKALNSDALFNPVTVSNKDREIFKFKNVDPKPEYVQEELGYRGQRLPADPRVSETRISEEKEIRMFTEALKPLARADIYVSSGKSDIVVPAEDLLNNKQEAGHEYANTAGSHSSPDRIESSLAGSISSASLVKEYTTVLDEHNFKINDIAPEKPVFTEIKPAVEPAGVDNKKAEPDLTSMKYIGQAFSTYILLQSGEELVLVDQHAAHERIIYEKLRVKFEERENNTQLLLEPVVIKFQAFELVEIKSRQELLNKIGFTFEDFGNNSIIIRGIPYALEGSSPRDIFLEIADKVLSNLKPLATPLADEIIHTIACKAAIKANKKLDDSEVIKLLEELSVTGRRYTCPHGRPTVIRLTKYEIEKMFKRIV